MDANYEEMPIIQPSFYFYDLETSGLSARTDRIMQFAGQRTDLQFQPIGEPDNILVQLSDDTLPGPCALMVTGITPNSTKADGLTEREFCEFLIHQVATPGTVIMGYNSVRFDDEFMRAILWRNFYDPYEWQWKDGRSRWDLLDVVRMTRALRPEGVNWPVTPDGWPTNRLELITKENHISHEHAHDALSDVEALISVTKLLKEKQPKMFDFLFKMRHKREVQELVNLNNPQMFVYSSGRYSGKYMYTTVAYPVAQGENGAVWVWDLRYNPEVLSTEDVIRSAILKKLVYNKCPAVAPVGVLTAKMEEKSGWDKIELDEKIVKKNLEELKTNLVKVQEFLKKLETEKNAEPRRGVVDAESAIYDGFLGDNDRRMCAIVRGNDAKELAKLQPKFEDKRLPELYIHYKARNFPACLSSEEREEWEKYRQARLNRQSTKFMREMEMIQKELLEKGSFDGKPMEECEFMLEELRLWWESVQS